MEAEHAREMASVMTPPESRHQDDPATSPRMRFTVRDTVGACESPHLSGAELPPDSEEEEEEEVMPKDAEVLESFAGMYSTVGSMRESEVRA